MNEWNGEDIPMMLPLLLSPAYSRVLRGLMSVQFCVIREMSITVKMIKDL